MRKLVEATVFASVAIIWVISVISIPFIPERCCVCHEQEGANPAERLRTLSVVQWAFDTTPDLHWTCQGHYDAAVHNPSGGVK